MSDQTPPIPPLPPGSAQPEEIEFVNPWKTIWREPRKTIRQIVEYEPTRGVLLIVSLSGLLQAIGNSSRFGEVLPVAAFIFWIAGPILAIAFLYFFGWLYRLVGSWLGGQGTSESLRAALAWSQLPTFVPAGVALLGFALASLGSFVVAAAAVLYLVSLLVFGIWSFILSCKTVGEVHKFSAWRGFFTMFLGNLIFAVPATILGLILAVAIPLVIAFSSPKVEGQLLSEMTPEQREAAQATAPPEMASFFEELSKVQAEEGRTGNLAAPAPAAPAEDKFDYRALQHTPAPVIITLKDGKSVEGRIMIIGANELYVDSAKGVVNVPKSNIADARSKEA